VATDEFTWPIEEHEGSWEAFESWSRPLAGVRIEGEHLRLEYRKPYVEGRGSFELAQRPDFRMVAAFAELSVGGGDCAADGRLLTFATRYGGLGLCKEHGWPLAHKRPHCRPDLSESPTTKFPL
jgi:hypothetical protein